MSNDTKSDDTMSDPAYAASFCAQLVRARDFTAYAAALFAPIEFRRGLLALGAFNVEVSQVRDHVTQAIAGEMRLQWWRDVIEGKSAGDAAGNPVASELLRTIEKYALPREKVVRLLDAHVFDVYDDPMPDMAALEAHCRDTAATLYEMRAKILGQQPAGISRIAEHAGIADGLVAIMLSLPRHSARRQLFLPGDLIKLHGVMTEEVFLRQPSDALNKTLAHLRNEARRQIDQAMAMLADVPKQARIAVLPLAQTARILKQLETADPFAPPLMSRLAVLWTLWRSASSNQFSPK